MSQHKSAISENSRRIARNTLLLYFRMLLMMIIGLYTSRVVLDALGETDYGVYNAVGSMVMVFTFITTSVSSAISRFLAVELGKGDGSRLRKVFSAGLAVQLIFAAALVILAETAGLWFLNERMNIPPDRMQAARLVFHCSLGVLVVNLLSVPYNATIIAHEKMSAFAFISILEAVLKLSVALVLYLTLHDKLSLYAFLTLAVALLVRLTYGLYCRRHFPESRGRLELDRSLIREMASFSGWSFFGSSAYVFNTQGVSSVGNIVFGVAFNAARGVALWVENIVKQFVTNFLTAINPQITKSWAAGDTHYCFELVSKGAKFSYLVILAFFIPFLFEAESILDLWLVDVPADSALFVRLTLVALMVDLFGNPVLTLMLATGDVKRYYLLTGLTSYLCLPLVWLAFKAGASAEWAYYVFIAIYLVVLVMKFALARSRTGFPVGAFLRNVLLPCLAVTMLSMILPCLVYLLMPQGLLRLLLVCASAWASMGLSVFVLALSPGERAFVTRKLGRERVPARVAIEDMYFEAFGRRPDLRHPRRFSEKLQWQKLHDHNPLYHTLADKAEVKSYVEEKIGREHVIPTLGVWNSVEEINWKALPERFVLKCTHDSGSSVICNDKASLDKSAVCAKLSAALRRNYYRRFYEWSYKGLRPRIIAEQYMGDDIADYKFFCFDGKPEVMFVATQRNSAEETKFDFFDMSYRHLDFCNGHPNAESCPPMPASFEEMKTLAAMLSEGMAQVRVDFYEIDGKIYFGEYTFYHWSGFMPYEPDSADEWMGDFYKIPAR